MKNHFKILLVLLCIIAIAVAVPACNNKNKTSDDTTKPKDEQTTTPPDTKVELSLNPSTLVIGIGETKKLSAKSSLTNMETSGVLWISDNPAVATVDTYGNVKGVSDGEATITVSTIDGTSTAECVVTVTSRVTDVKFNEENKVFLEVGESRELSYSIIPENAANKGVTWKSSDESVATVSPNGVVTALKNGTTSIVVTTDEGKISAACSVDVITSVKQIIIEKSEWHVTKGTTFTISYTIFPANATYPNLTWDSSDHAVATVTGNGFVTPVGAGSAIITAKAHNGLTAQCLVDVKASVSGVVISQQQIQLIKGEERQLSAEIIPADASNKNVTWRSRDTSIATVSQSGIVTARKTGTVIISVVTQDGSKTAECEVTVINPLKSIVFDKTSLTLTIFDDPVTLVPTFDPIDADDLENVRWASNNNKVATVSASGVVTAVGPGTAEITLSTIDGIHASCTVTVPENAKIPVSSISVEKRYVTLRAGEIHTPKVTILPVDAGDKTYILTSSDPSVVRVNSNGTITAISKGNATITVASTSNPDIKQEFSVDVKDLTPDEINSSIAKYNAAIEQENNRYASALSALNSRYSYLADLKAKFDTEYAGFNESAYKSQKAALEKNISDYRTALTEAENASNMELVTQYTNLIAKAQEDLSALEKKWKNYSSELAIYNEDNVKFNNDKAVEDKLHADNLASIKKEYAFILPYLPAT